MHSVATILLSSDPGRLDGQLNEEAYMSRASAKNLLSCVGVALFLLAGACSPGWKVVKTSSPSALKGAGPVAVTFDYSKLIVGGMDERAFVESKKAKEPDYDATWAKLKGSFEESVLGGFGQRWPQGGVRAAAPGPGVGLVVYPTSLTMGHYMVVAATATSVSTSLSWTVNGQPVEEISVTGAETPTIYTPSVHQHIPGIGSYIGGKAGKYLSTRQ
jgi:hypothetical protein